MTPEKKVADNRLWASICVRRNRIILLVSIGALAGLGIAGFALFTARGTSTLVAPAEDVALVNQQPIARADFQHVLQNTLGVTLADATQAQKKKVLDDMIREELFVQRGNELDVAATDPDVRIAMMGALEQAIAAQATSTVPSETQLRAYYAQHRADFSSAGAITARDLVFPPSQAIGALANLRAGADVDAVLAAYGGHESTRNQGETFYFAARNSLGRDLFKIASALNSGQISEPVGLPDGAHLLDVIKNQRPAALDFKQVRSEVLAAYQKAIVARAEAADEQSYRKRANIVIAEDLQ